MKKFVNISILVSTVIISSVALLVPPQKSCHFVSVPHSDHPYELLDSEHPQEHQSKLRSTGCVRNIGGSPVQTEKLASRNLCKHIARFFRPCASLQRFFPQSAGDCGKPDVAPMPAMPAEARASPHEGESSAKCKRCGSHRRSPARRVTNRRGGRGGGAAELGEGKRR